MFDTAPPRHDEGSGDAGLDSPGMVGWFINVPAFGAEQRDCRYGFTAGAAHEAIKFLVWESYPRQRQSFCSKIEPLVAVKLAFGFYKQG